MRLHRWQSSIQIHHAKLHAVLFVAAFLALSIGLQAQTFQTVPQLAFTKAFAGAEPLPQVLTIAYTDQSTVRFTVSASTNSGGNWLSTSPSGSGCCNTPLAVSVSVAAGNLAAGSYTGQVVITNYSNGNIKMTIPVTLTIAAAGATFFDDLPGKFSFSFTSSENPVSQALQIRNAGAGTLNWTLTPSTADGGNWLTASSSGGAAPSIINIGISKSDLPGGGAVAGTYVGQLLFQTAGDTTTIPVAVTVGAAVFEQLNPISFTMPFGGANALPQILNVAMNDNSTVRFSGSVATAKGGNWLSISPAGSGCCNSPLAVTASVINATSLAAGSYTGEIIFTQYANPGLSLVVPVNLTILNSGAFFDTLPGQMSFSLTKGAGSATPQVLQIRNGGTGTLNWNLTATTADGGNWLKSSAASGAAPSTPTIEIDVTQLPGGGAIAGTFVGALNLIAAGDTSTIPVTVTVGTSVFLETAPVSFTMPFGGANPLPQIVTVALSDNTTARFSVSAATSNGGSWLSVSPAGSGCCNTPLALTASVNASTLAAGSYTGEIIVTEYANPGRSMVIPVTLAIDNTGAFFDTLPGQMNFAMNAGAKKVSTQTLQLGNGGTGKLKWTLTPSTADDGAWLLPTPLSGTSTPKTITVKIDPTALPGAGKIAGTYTGQLLFQASTGFATVPVAVTVGPGAFQETQPLTFVMPAGGANPLPQVLSLATTDNSTIRFSASAVTAKGGSWLQISTSGSGCCNSPFPLRVSVSAGSLPAGVYTGEINLIQYANPGTSMTVPVTLNVVSSGKAFFDNLPGQTSFSFKPSSSNPPSQTITVGNGGSSTLAWSVAGTTADAGKWLKVLPTKGTNAGAYTVSVTAKSLPGKGLIAGTYTESSCSRPRLATSPFRWWSQSAIQCSFNFRP